MGLFGFGKKKEKTAQEEVRITQREVNKPQAEEVRKTQREEVPAKFSEEMKELFSQNEGVAVVNYIGMTVADDTLLRKKLRDNNMSFGVYRSTYVRVFLTGTKFEGLKNFCEGPCAYAFFNNKEQLCALIMLFKKMDNRAWVEAACFQGEVYNRRDLEAMVEETVRKIDKEDGVAEGDNMLAREIPAYDVILQDCGVTKIEVIKVIRDLMNLGLKEAKDFADSVSSSRGATVIKNVDSDTADAYVDRLSAVGATAKKTENGATLSVSAVEYKAADNDMIYDETHLYDVAIASHNGNKLGTVKVVYLWTGMGLKESKELVDRLDYESPIVVLQDVDYKTAKEAVEMFKDNEASALLVDKSINVAANLRNHDYYIGKMLNK